jgi:hypothetical protein
MSPSPQRTDGTDTSRNRRKGGVLVVGSAASEFVDAIMLPTRAE